MSEEERIEKLDALGTSLAVKRSDAIAARESSGIEQQWMEDEEFYQGIDDLNRNEHSNAWRTKPPGSYQVQATSTTRSTVFVNITQPYCNAAAARIADMLLPSDDRNFAIQATPLPDLVGLAKGKIPANIQATAAKAPDQSGVQAQLTRAAQAAKLMVDAATEKAKKAETRIEDWLVECQYHAEVRKMIEDASRIGSGVLKGPIPIKSRQIALENGALIIKLEIKPGSKRIDPWNFYPDGACGDSIHNGSCTWERDHLTPRQLKDLKGTPGYIDSQIDACLEEGPQQAIATTKKDALETQQKSEDEKRFEIWYFHGFVEKENLIAAGCECEDGQTPSIPAMVTMVNNRVVRASLNPLDSGDFPYDVMPWQRKQGMPWGNGVARQGRTPQRIVNAGVRNMMDNGGISAGPQIVIKQGAITPADGQWAITPRKVWNLGADGDMDDVRKAMAFFEVPSRQAELMAIVQFGLKMMEDATGLPMLLQGQLGKAPDTVGGMTMLNNNASAVLRRLARTFDDCVTEPHIRRYYTWLLQYGEDDEKGDFSIDARGSSALVERDLQAQEISQMANIVGNPIFGIDPKKWARELLKSRKFDAKNFEYDDTEWEQLVQKLTQKQHPLVEVAQVKEQGATQRKGMEIQADAAADEKDNEVKLLLGQVNERIAEIKAGNAKELTFAELKGMLAATAMKVSAQKELSAASLAVDVHKHHVPAAVMTPPVEPAGRAQQGQSFQQ